MKVQQRDGGDERLILTGLIVSNRVVGSISVRWQDNLFRNRYANLIAKWCVRYYRKYNNAPRQAIKTIFRVWADSHPDQETTITAIEKSLVGLSREYRKSAADNPEYVLDLADKHFNHVRLERLSEEMQYALEDGRPEQAQELLNSSRRVEIGSDSAIDVLTDVEAIQEAFSSNTEALIKYPGALGEFFGDSFCRDGFVAFTGPAKRGKSWWLLDLAWRAMSQRRKVAFFEVGDMSKNQIMMRLMIRAAKHPLKPGKVDYPVGFEYQEKAPPLLEFKLKEYGEPLDWRRAVNACRQVVKTRVKSKDSYLRLSCHPNSSIDVDGIRSIIDGWSLDGWVPDVIVIDYADILKSPQGVVEYRDQVNMTWRMLRRMSQELHCLVVTATQADAASYETTLVTRKNFSDDRRKHDHVTGTIGINVTDKEKEESRCRLNWIDRREENFYERLCVYVGSCLSLGNVAVVSSFAKGNKQSLKKDREPSYKSAGGR